MKKKLKVVTEIPDRWLLLKLPNNYYKIFATWNDTSWKLNSGINKVEQDDYNYYIYGFSGNCYKCHKKQNGIATKHGDNVLKNISMNQLDIVEDYHSVLNKFK